jgi:crotonobetainyl-CoA:carnitine CoA-transferase CaiB-like acyl-CoA transferase
MLDRLDDDDLPLARVVVADFSQYLAGPTAALRLADLGATVYKVERPAGDAGRQLALGGALIDGDSVSFHASNRNKRHVVLDLKKPGDADAARQLVNDADVLIEGFRPGVMTRLGLDYDTVRQSNPTLVYGRVTGYGDDGPWRAMPGQDLLVQAVSGMMWLNGTADDPPSPIGLSIVDITAGQILVQAVLAALLRRERRGVGALVEVSLLEAALDLQSEVLAARLNGAPPPERSRVGAGHPYLGAPYGVYRTADGWIALAMNDVVRIGALLGIPDLAKFDDPARWHTERDHIKTLIADAIASRRTDDVLPTLAEAGMWATEVFSWDKLLAHDAVRALSIVQRIARAGAPAVQVIRAPIRIDGRILASDVPAPRLEDDNCFPTPRAVAS